MKNIVLKISYKTGSLLYNVQMMSLKIIFIAFRDAKRLLSANDKYEVPYSKAWKAIFESLCISADIQTMYNEKYFCLSLEDTLATAQWINVKLNN